VFEPQTTQTQNSINAEVQRVAGGDPRIFISDVQSYPQENGILIEVQLTVVPTQNAEILSIFFDQQQRKASYV
jgi:hypothetical protein